MPGPSFSQFHLQGHSWLETGGAAKFGHLGRADIGLQAPAISCTIQRAPPAQRGCPAGRAVLAICPPPKGTGGRGGFSPETSSAEVSVPRSVDEEVARICSCCWQLGGMGQAAPLAAAAAAAKFSRVQLCATP